jgi:holo-[acyl-carrier protein] synthase
MTGGSIVGLGIDIVELERIGGLLERHQDRFVARYCTPAERSLQERGGYRVERLGGLFAAKEAVLKALGTGWGEGLGWQQIEVLPDPRGAPKVTLRGPAAERAAALGGRTVHVSISHERRYAAAVAILERTAPRARPRTGRSR